MNQTAISSYDLIITFNCLRAREAGHNDQVSLRPNSCLAFRRERKYRAHINAAAHPDTMTISTSLQYHIFSLLSQQMSGDELLDNERTMLPLRRKTVLRNSHSRDDKAKNIIFAASVQTSSHSWPQHSLHEPEEINQ